MSMSLCVSRLATRWLLSSVWTLRWSYSLNGRSGSQMAPWALDRRVTPPTHRVKACSHKIPTALGNLQIKRKKTQNKQDCIAQLLGLNSVLLIKKKSLWEGYFCWFSTNFAHYFLTHRDKNEREMRGLHEVSFWPLWCLFPKQDNYESLEVLQDAVKVRLKKTLDSKFEGVVFAWCNIIL